MIEKDSGGTLIKEVESNECVTAEAEAINSVVGKFSKAGLVFCLQSYPTNKCEGQPGAWYTGWQSKCFGQTSHMVQFILTLCADDDLEEAKDLREVGKAAMVVPVSESP